MPQIFNHTPLELHVLPLVDPRGCIVAAVIAKVTFDIVAGGRLKLSAEPEPIRFVDERLGSGDVRMPSDLAAHKPAADVVVALPRSARRAEELDGVRVRIRVGKLQISKKIEKPWPLGPVPPEAKPRASLAGTYDDTWVRERMPLLPIDFDPRFHLVAPPDQRVPGSLTGDEHIEIAGLYPGDPIAFNLPARCLLVSGNVQSRYFTEIATLDTLVLDAESPRLMLVWRHTIALRQKFEELSNLSLGLARLRTVHELYGRK